MAEKELSRAEEEALLVEIRERFQYAWGEWQPVIDSGNKDMRAVAGDPWEPTERAEREKAMRPVLALDELGQYFNQIINDVRANPIAMKFDPTGDGTSEKGAEFYADKAREIEYRSHAQIAYTTAFENTIHRSFGWSRLATRFAKKSHDQEIWVEEVSDPNAVIPDPDFKRPDASDINYLFFIETRTKDEFKRQFPKAKIQDFSGDLLTLAPMWIKEDRVQIAEYWKKKTAEKVLLRITLPVPPAPPAMPGQPPPVARPPQTIDVYEDELPGGKVPDGATIVKTRKEEVTTVCQYLTNGVEILKTTEWAGSYIPFSACLGKILYVDLGAGTKRIIMSMTRLALDPYMLYCYYRTQQAEMAGMVPKVPVMGYKGQFRGNEEEWQKAPHEPMAYLEADAQPEGWNPSWGPAPLPQRLAYSAGEHLQALELCAEGARRSIQAAMGSSPLPTQAQRRNEKSGVALKQIDSTAQKGSFHFIDHYQDMIRHVAVMVEDLMDKIYDTARTVGVRKPNETALSVRINDPSATDAQGQPAHLPTEGDYQVTVSTGPSTDSTREAASDFADQLVQNPQVFPLIASEVVRLKNLGPIGDQIADALEILKPPELRKQKDGQPPLPPEAQQAMAENAQLKQQLQQAAQAIQTDQAKQQATIQVEQMKAKVQIVLKHMDNAAKIETARISAAKASLDTAAAAQEERLATGLTISHEANQAELDRQHEVALAAASHGAQAAAQGADQAHAAEQAAAERDAAERAAMAQAATQGE